MKPAMRVIIYTGSTDGQGGSVRGGRSSRNNGGGYEGVKSIKMRAGIMSLETSLCKITIGL